MELLHQDLYKSSGTLAWSFTKLSEKPLESLTKYAHPSKTN